MLPGRISELYRSYGTMIRFAFVGGTTYLLTMLLFSLFYNLLGAGHDVAATGAYFLGVSYHFTMNRAFTFGHGGTRILPQLWKYGLLTAANYVVTLVLFEVLLGWMTAPALVPFALSVAVTTATGYVVMRFWVFRSVEKT